MLPFLRTELAIILALHIAPSATENNRYVKFSVSPTALRVVYTIYFGERPGLEIRHRMDQDRDGRISEGEQQAFVRDLCAEVGRELRLVVDGRDAIQSFAPADVGLGVPSVRAGSFSVDLAVEVPLANNLGEHTLFWQDNWRIPHPGETQLWFRLAPGAHLVETRLGEGARGTTRSFSYRGESRNRELWARLATDPQAAGAASHPQNATANPKRARVPAWLTLILVAVLLGAPFAWRLVRRRRE